jgi:hypothetical protein
LIFEIVEFVFQRLLAFFGADTSQLLFLESGARFFEIGFETTIANKIILLQNETE